MQMFLIFKQLTVGVKKNEAILKNRVPLCFAPDSITISPYEVLFVISHSLDKRYGLIVTIILIVQYVIHASDMQNSIVA